MGKTIKPKPTGIIKAKGKAPNNSRNFNTNAPRQYSQSATLAPRVSTPPLTEAIPEDTMRFSDLGAENLLDPILLKTITEDLKFDHMMPVSNFLPPPIFPLFLT